MATMTSASTPSGLFRRAAAAAGALAFAALLSACAVENPFTVSGLPESPDIETAPWPSLASAPPPRSAGGVQQTVAKGDVIATDIDSEVARLKADVAKLEARPVITGNLAAEAARLRAEARALAAR